MKLYTFRTIAFIGAGNSAGSEKSVCCVVQIKGKKTYYYNTAKNIVVYSNCPCLRILVPLKMLFNSK